MSACAGLNTVFGFTRACLCTASKPRKLLFYELIAFVAFDFAQRLLLGLFLKIIGVITAKILHSTPVHLKDAVRHAIKKVAVVRDQQQHAGVTP